MKLWRTLAALPVALLASQAVAESWVSVAGDEQVDKDSIRRGSDGLVYFSNYDKIDGEGRVAIDCQRRLYYLLDDVPEGEVYSKWSQFASASEIKPNTNADVELGYVCANPPDSPFGSLRVGSHR